MNNSRTFGSDQPPALLHLFEPPDGHVGSFGWLCGYSADAYFLDAAAERFAHRTRRRRSAEGEVALGLILDSGSPGSRSSMRPAYCTCRSRRPSPIA